MNFLYAGVPADVLGASSFENITLFSVISIPEGKIESESACACNNPKLKIQIVKANNI